MTNTDTPSTPAVVRPTFQEHSGYWVLTDSPFNNEWNDGVLVTIEGADSTAGYDDEETGDYIVTEADFDVIFVNGPRTSRNMPGHKSYGYGSVPDRMLRRPNRSEALDAEGEAAEEKDRSQYLLDEAQHRFDQDKERHAELERFYNGFDGDEWDSHVSNRADID